MLEECPGQIRYVVPWSSWVIWDGRCHQPDSALAAEKLVSFFASRMEAVLEVVMTAERQAAVLSLPMDVADSERKRVVDAALEKWKPAAKYAAGLRKSAGASSLTGYLRTLAATDGSELESDNPEWLNCANGTVDLRTGQIRPHNPADMLTHCLDLPYLPDAQCPQFTAMAYRMCGCDREVFWYLLKLLGYSLIGDNRQQKIVFISGPTGSGKSQVLYIVRSVLGALAHESQAELITLSRHGRNARTENSIRGKRLVTITETSAFMTIDEGQLKRITGEPVISVDQHYSKTELKTRVSWLIAIATNQMPSLVNYDAAMRRRIIVVPSGDTIPDELMDDRIAERVLASEREGILALLIRAAGEYFRTGLAMPLAVRLSTDQYAAEQNTVSNFLADATTPNAVCHIPQTELWQEYQRWSRGEGKLGRNEFYEALKMQPGLSWDEVSRRYWGVQWNGDVAARLQAMPR
jgi:putative DNA primase/helicase